jgi:predicted DNA-binding transcriptional regulator YafY
MPRPKATNTGKVTEIRETLNVYRRMDPVRFKSEIARISNLYASTGSIRATAERLNIGKRTLERMMVDVPELGQAINSLRALG